MTNQSMILVAGVDTHKDTHYAAVITVTGQHLGAAEFPSTSAGYRALREFITCHGPLLRVGVEGTNSYGAGLCRHLVEHGIEITEVIRPKRQIRRMRGKSDQIDAYAAAATALAATDTVTAKTSDGVVEALRITNAARRSALKAHTEAIVQIKSLLVTAPDQVRDEYRDLTTAKLVPRLAASRHRAGDDTVSLRTRIALKRLAQRYQRLDEEIQSYDADLAELVDSVNPALVQAKGISAITAAQLLITAGDNPERVASEAAFAMLCGAAPIPASSGRTNRHRLNRGGDRAANSALHRIALVRLATDPGTRAYADKRLSESKSKKDVLRCLKRAIAREVYRLIVHPQPAETSDDLRPARQRQGLTLTRAANALGCSPLKLSRLERGHINDVKFLHEYRTWLAEEQPLKTAA